MRSIYFNPEDVLKTGKDSSSAPMALGQIIMPHPPFQANFRRFLLCKIFVPLTAGEEPLVLLTDDFIPRTSSKVHGNDGFLERTTLPVEALETNANVENVVHSAGANIRRSSREYILIIVVLINLVLL
jgi:hypothetical protein